MLLEIKNLSARVADTEKPILKGLNLTIKPGEVHAIMGPNGSGKSTLSNVISGHESYEVTEGTIEFNGKNLLDMEIDERAGEGVFMAFQYPVEIPGVSNKFFLQTALNSILEYRGESTLNTLEFNKRIKQSLQMLDMPAALLERSVNVGFSGGEKKRNDIFQMAVLNPKLGILDETDSGLDIDAMQAVAKGINQLRSADRSFLIITHYQRLLNYVEPDFVHVLNDGTIARTGDKSLAFKLEEEGYAWIS